MRLWTHYRKPTIVAASTAVVLAFSVFLWGLEYKLSLYHPPNTFARLVPIAKLLSKNEQPRIAASASASSAGLSLAPAVQADGSGPLLVAAILIGLSLSSVRIRMPQTVPASVRRGNWAYCCFVRPPPSLA